MRSPADVDFTNYGQIVLPTTLTHNEVLCVNEVQRLPNITRLLAELKPLRCLVFCNSEVNIAFFLGQTDENRLVVVCLRVFLCGIVCVCSPVCSCLRL